jgi:Protein of unknown function (DUF2785)
MAKGELEPVPYINVDGATMEITFWKSIQANNYAVPEGYSVEQLTPELLGYLASSDPELRDDFTLRILAYWMYRGLYNSTDLRQMIAKLGENLTSGIGESNTDSVFLRSFSALLLAEMVNFDNKHPYLEETEIRMLLLQALAYLGAEMDGRGYVTGKGWAHACAHTADWLMVLARSRYIGKADQERIMKGISTKILSINNPVYIHDEDERLVNVVGEVLQRDLSTEEFLLSWLDGLAHPAGFAWEQAFLTEGGGRACHNAKCFVRSLYLRLLKADPQPPHANELLPKIKETLQIITPWF